MAVLNNPFVDYPNPVFIETGTHLGDGVQKALDAGFEKVISIELADKYYLHCRNRFLYDPRVEIIQGDSFKVLPDILEKLDCPATFWLDGHHSGYDTGLGEHWTPLMQELQAIADHHIKTHTILIDDMRCWEKPNPVHGFYKQDILDFIPKINAEYTISYIDGIQPEDVMVLKV